LTRDVKKQSTGLLETDRRPEPIDLPDAKKPSAQLGDEAMHDWGRVHDCFHEVVLIDRPAGQITLVVAADD
jgi:hypothetical protein